MEEANNSKAIVNIEFTRDPKSRLLEVLELVYEKNNKRSSKIMTVHHSKLKEMKENFSKPSPDKVIHINRND